MSLSPEELLARTRRLTDLGHKKRNASLVRQVELALKAPGAPLPQAAGHGPGAWADLTSLYRFADNADISLKALRELRTRVVEESLPEEGDTRVVHDVSLLDFSGQKSKTDRRPIGDHRGQGYEYHGCVAVDPQGGRLLGVLHDTVVNAQGPDDQDHMNYDIEPLFADFRPSEQKELRENHRHQMAVHVLGLAESAGSRRLIHVADRKFDDLFLLERCQRRHQEFVIRSMANRNVQAPQADWIPPHALTRRQAGYARPDGWVCAQLANLVDSVPLQPYKDLPLDRRGRVTEPRRAQRAAHLSIGACRVRLYRQAKRNHRYFRPPAPVELNWVVIRETDPPPGEKALLWVLFTSLPVDTPERLFYVGRIYELRWKIEDFFKLLKSGWHIERLRFDRAEKMARIWVVLTLAAMVLFHLKTDLNLPAEGKLDDESYRQLQQATQNLYDPDIDLRWRLLAFIAKSGGWLGRRGDPLGPQILMRGLLPVLAVCDAVAHHGPLLQEFQDHPDILRQFICV